MNKFLIEGGYPLKGRISLLGAKNSSFKLMIAALLSNEPSVITNVPQIGDVRLGLEIIKSLGGEIKKLSRHSFSISGKTLASFKIPQNLGIKSRSSCMFIGPLLNRFGQAVLPCPGGDKIGRRPIERHLEGLKAMGVKIAYENGFFRARVKKIKGAIYRFPKNSHTGTETLIMTAVLAEGKSVLENAAEEPEVDDLISFLNKMGAKIRRIKPRVIEIIGVTSLQGTNYQVMFDRNEAVTFACAALATRGDIFVVNAKEKNLAAFLGKLKKTGAGVEKFGSGIRFFYRKSLKATKVVTASHPGFMTDWQPLWTVLMTQAKGQSLVHETIFENRFGYVRYLKKMGAKIEEFRPKVENPKDFYNFNLDDDRPEYFHAIRILGPTSLKGGEISIPDIRAGATLLLAALTAKDKTILSNIDHIDRGYENLDVRLRKLGAKIKRI